MRFYGRGHENLRAEHKTTLELTKDAELTTRGDCIVGVSANFDIAQVKAFLKGRLNFNMEIKCGSHTFALRALANPDFNDEQEMVVRMGSFLSKRTIGTHSDKAACHIPREMVELMKNPDTVIEVTLS